MESLKNVKQLIRHGVWMGSIDLKDAYYSVRVNESFQKYFTCYWNGCYYEFLRMPNGYAQAPPIFTKLLKQVFGFLRKHGYSSVVYIDDSYLQGDTYAHCLENIHATEKLLTSLGFAINHEKSVAQPAQRLLFLGFVLDSITMTISLTEKRKHILLDMCKNLLSDGPHTIRTVVSAVSCIIAALPGVKYGGLYYRHLKQCKNFALKRAKGNYGKPIKLTLQAKQDLSWWSHNLMFASHFIHTPPVLYTLYSDASLEGWGGTDGTSHVGGRWTAEESPVHIIVLELLAAKLTLLALAPSVWNTHIRLMLDNTTAAAYIDKMGGLHSPACNDVALAIWTWAKDRHNWLSTAYIPGVDNTVADFHS